MRGEQLANRTPPPRLGIRGHQRHSCVIRGTERTALLRLGLESLPSLTTRREEFEKAFESDEQRRHDVRHVGARAFALAAHAAAHLMREAIKAADERGHLGS